MAAEEVILRDLAIEFGLLLSAGLGATAVGEVLADRAREKVAKRTARKAAKKKDCGRCKRLEARVAALLVALEAVTGE